MARFEKCRNCGDMMPSDATFCVRCGAPGPKHRRRQQAMRLLLWPLLVILLIVGPHLAFGRDSQAAGQVLEQAHRGAERAVRGAGEVAREIERLVLDWQKG